MKKWLGNVFARMAGVDVEKQSILIKTQDDRIATLNEELSNIKETTAVHGATAKAKDGQIETLKKEIDNLKKSTADEKSDTKKKDSQISALETKLASLQQRFEDMEAEASSPESEESPTPIPPTNPKKKAPKTDPYQQLSEDLVNALKMTTKGKDQPKKGE